MRTAILLALLAAPALAGPLDPPMGPPSSTMKTLEEVEPRTIITQSDIPLVITHSGSYALAEDVVAPLGATAAITIEAPRVTLDLQGFSISAQPGSPRPLHAIQAPGNPSERDAIDVRHGVIEGDFGFGVRSAEDVESIRLTDLHISNCLVGVEAWNATITRCESSDNTGDGFVLHGAAVVSDSAARRNDSTGFNVLAAATVSRCIASENGAGFSFDDSGPPETAGSSVTGCTARDNASGGFFLGRAIAASNCTSTGSTQGSGFFLSTGASAMHCTSIDNAEHGFRMVGATATDCTAHSNGEAGFYAAFSSVRSCTSTGNDDGMILRFASSAIGNHIQNNQTHGVLVPIVSNDDEIGCRIEANHFDENDIAILLEEDSCIVIANTIHDSFTGDIVNNGDNVIGEIIDLSAAGGVLTSGNPWANIIH